jgi:F-type H+-transporting ATPase subunit b
VINLDIAFVIQAINFGILLLILNMLLYKPIRKVLADRQGELIGAKEKVAAVDREVQEKIALYEARLKEVKSTASGDREVLKKEAQAEEAAILDKARKEATDSLASIKNKVAKEAADARALLREQANALSLDICEKVLGRSL